MWRNVSVWHLLILVLAFVIMFGWKRLPDASRSLGRSLRIFKSEVDQLRTDGDKPSAASRETVPGTARDSRSGVSDDLSEDDQPSAAPAAAPAEDFPRRSERDGTV